MSIEPETQNTQGPVGAECARSFAPASHIPERLRFDFPKGISGKCSHEGVRVCEELLQSRNGRPGIGSKGSYRASQNPSQIPRRLLVGQSRNKRRQPSVSNMGQDVCRAHSASGSVWVIQQLGKTSDSTVCLRAEGVKGPLSSSGHPFLIVRELPRSIHAHDDSVGGVIKLALPGRSLVPEPPQKIRKRVRSDVDDSFFPQVRARNPYRIGSWNQWSSNLRPNITTHPLTQSLPRILRLPLPPGRPDEQPNERSTPNHRRINSSLPHGVNMDSPALKSSRKEAEQLETRANIQRSTFNVQRSTAHPSVPLRFSVVKPHPWNPWNPWLIPNFVCFVYFVVPLPS